MVNQLIIVGRLVERPVLEKTENEKKASTIVLAVGRSFKNDNGEYDTDFIPVSLVGQIAVTTCEYCEKGDTIAIKGRVARMHGNDVQIVADKVTFLAKGKKVDE